MLKIKHGQHNRDVAYSNIPVEWSLDNDVQNEEDGRERPKQCKKQCQLLVLVAISGE